MPKFTTKDKIEAIPSISSGPPSVRQSHRDRCLSKRLSEKENNSERSASFHISETGSPVATSSGRRTSGRRFGAIANSPTVLPRETYTFDKERELALVKNLNASKVSLERTKKQLAKKSEEVLDLKGDIQELRRDVEKMEEESDIKDAVLTRAMDDTQQYRDWWMNEIQFTKLLMHKIPHPQRDMELARQTQAHYMGHI